jgi:hypothetical protein
MVFVVAGRSVLGGRGECGVNSNAKLKPQSAAHPQPKNRYRAWAS